MRGGDDGPEGLFSYVSCEARVPPNHPLRPIRAICDEALEVLSADFETLYSKVGRPSIRSERQLMEQMDYNLLFRWFVGLAMDAAVWDVTVFTKNRERFLAAVVGQARGRNLLSDEHFSVDGTLIDAWASMKSFKPKDGGGDPPGPGRNGERDFRGEKRSNQTHASTTDPEAKLYRKANGQSSRMAFMGHVLMENRNGLVVGAVVTQATGTAEREAALKLVDGLNAKGRITLGADKAYDVRDFVRDLRARKVTPHIARNEQMTKDGTLRRSSAIDGRTTRHPGYAISLRIRKRIEEVFGWAKTTGGLRKTRHKGTDRVDWVFALTAAAYNLVRLPKLMAAA
jgi:transposase